MAISLTLAAAAALCVLAALLPAAEAVAAVPAIFYDNGGGIITGTRLRSAGQAGAAPRDYAAFWGVPYAEPPVGALRFKPPRPRDLPTGMFAATNVSTPICIQQTRHPHEIVGEEDCLTLQIYTPNYDDPILPVMVLIHGGGFMFGKGPRTGVQYIMDHEVVLVNVDYRLGLLGYMSFEDAELRGNLGMLDQVEALKWVQRNIHHFGGNNKNVTLVGNSAGSASCLLHTMSPLSKGLFHRVIGMSGTPLNPWTRQYSARDNANLVANKTGCDMGTTAQKLACLQKVPARDLVALQGEHFQHWMDNPFSPFAPVVDGTFLTEEPTRLLATRSAVMDVPLMLSFVPEEGLYTAGEFLANDALVTDLDKNWEAVAPQLLFYHDKRVPDAEMPHLLRKIRDKYIGNRTLVEAKMDLLKMMTDRNFLAGLADYITRRAQAQSSPVFVYEFAHRGQYSLYPGGMGVSHADDFQYAIEFLDWSGVFQRPSDMAVRKNLLDSWVAFAQHSNPNVLPEVDWRPTDTSGGAVQYLRIAGPDVKDMTMVRDKDLGNAAFWRDLNGDSARAQSSLVLCLASATALLLTNLRTS